MAAYDVAAHVEFDDSMHEQLQGVINVPACAGCRGLELSIVTTDTQTRCLLTAALIYFDVAFVSVFLE